MKTCKQDRFLIDGDRITWISHNPDADSGSQFVINTFPVSMLEEVVEECLNDKGKYDAYEAFFRIEDRCRQELIDIGTPEYDKIKELFESEEKKNDR